MTKKEALQNRHFEQLSNSEIEPINARFLAFSFQEMNVNEIVKIEPKNETEFVITTDIKKYLVTLPIIPIFDASIEEIGN